MLRPTLMAAVPVSLFYLFIHSFRLVFLLLLFAHFLLSFLLICLFKKIGNHGPHQQERDEQSAGNELHSEEAVYIGLQI